MILPRPCDQKMVGEKFNHPILRIQKHQYNVHTSQSNVRHKRIFFEEEKAAGGIVLTLAKLMRIL